jgi:hypothetical protein
LAAVRAYRQRAARRFGHGIDLALQGAQHLRAILDFHLSLQQQEAGRMIG